MDFGNPSVDAASAAQSEQPSHKKRLFQDSAGSQQIQQIMQSGGQGMKKLDLGKLQELLILLIKSQLATSQQMRCLRSAILDVYIIPIQGDLMTALKTASHNYTKHGGDALTNQKRIEAIGFLHHHRWNNFVKLCISIAQQNQSQALLAELQQYVEAVKASGGFLYWAKSCGVRVMRLEKAFERSEIKLVFNVEHECPERAIYSKCQAMFTGPLKGRRMAGQAAPGRMETLLQGFLESSDDSSMG